MNLLGIGSIIKSVGSIADDLFTSDEERLKAVLQERKIEADLIKGQLDINSKEAQHNSVFVAGWRPFIGWVGGAALTYQFILYPLLVWIWALGQAQGWLPCYIDPEQAKGVCDFTAPPVFDTGPLIAILTSMLGIGAFRSFDKIKGVDTKSIRKK